MDSGLKPKRRKPQFTKRHLNLVILVAVHHDGVGRKSGIRGHLGGQIDKITQNIGFYMVLFVEEKGPKDDKNHLLVKTIRYTWLKSL